MPIRRMRPITFKATGCSDTFDATNVFPGAMQQLSNLIPAPQMMDGWVPRPASLQITDFTGFTTPANGEALFNNGSRIYGFIQSGLHAGKSEPFVYDLTTDLFISITGITASNVPTSTSNTGAWVPPTIDRVGGYVIFTHPGFDGTTHYFGWLDMTGFTSSSLTGDTHTSTAVDNLSANVFTAGWRPGMLISDSAGDIPADTTIVSIAADGLSLVLSAAATGSNAGTTFTVQGGSLAAPLWAAGNTSINPLLAVPTAVAQYAGSACFAVNTDTSSAVVISDAGNALVVTNATQVATFQNAVDVTALKGTPLYTINGGVIQALYAFQGPAAIWQITGSPATSNLALNQLNDSIGTLAPNTVRATPKGILFAAPDGVRRISLVGNIEKVVGRRGMGVSSPFLFASEPSRMAAAYNEGVYRISVENASLESSPYQEWWYHEEDERWTGPHTFPAALITATQEPHSFAMFAIDAQANPPIQIPAKMWSSDAYTSLSATYVENGIQMVYLWQTSLLPDNAQAAMNSVVEATIGISLPGDNPATLVVANDYGQTLDTVTISADASPSLWDQALWDQAIWDGSGTVYRQRIINLNYVWVFKQATIAVTGNSGYPLRIGDLYMLSQVLGYDKVELLTG